jgi:hypothetical protein
LIALGGWLVAIIGQISGYRSRKPGSQPPKSRKCIAGMFVLAGVICEEFQLTDMAYKFVGDLKST